MSRQPFTRCPAQRQRGYTMIEILVALFIALFLLAGLFTILQATRRTSSNQTGLTKLQDEQRMAMSILIDVIQNAGYFDTNTSASAQAALPAVASVSLTGTAMTAGQALSGTHTATTAPDQLVVRYSSTGSDGVINCSGGTTTGAITNVFFISSGTSTSPATSISSGTSILRCSPDGTLANAVPLVDDVANLQVWYGVSTQAGTNNVDSYITANNMTSNNWSNVTSLRVTLTFLNPMYSATTSAQQPQYVYFTRVVAVQGRTGVTL
jgi:type IV pilus assembly protein PilW